MKDEGVVKGVARGNRMPRTWLRRETAVKSVIDAWQPAPNRITVSSLRGVVGEAVDTRFKRETRF